MTTFVIILVLVVIGVAAVVSVPMMIRSTRRHEIPESGGRRPIMGSPAQVWIARGERVQRELEAALAEHGVWEAVTSDSAAVVAELRLTGGQVAEVDHAIATIQDPGRDATLRQTRDTLVARMESAVAGLEQARAEVAELIATAALSPADPEPAAQLTSRLAGLRAGLVEVRKLSDPESGSGAG